MRYFIVIALLASCGDNKSQATRDAGVDAPTNLKACIDRPDELPRAPNGQLTCDLLPPGLELK